MRHITTFVPFDDLKTSRLVCQDWNTQASSIVKRKHAPLKLYDKEALDKFFELTANSNFSNFPFGNFTVTQRSLETENVTLFYQRIGPSISNLGIFFREKKLLEGNKVSYERLVEVFEFLPNLTRLELLCCEAPERNPEKWIDYKHLSEGSLNQIKLHSLQSITVSTGYSYGCLVDLFSRAGNLKKLELNDERYVLTDYERVRNYVDSSSFYQAMRVSIPSDKPLHLTIWNELKAKHIEILKLGRFRFSKLQIQSGHLEEHEEEDLMKFIEAQARSLRYLQLEGSGNGRPFNITNFFKLKNLLSKNIIITDSSDHIIQAVLNPTSSYSPSGQETTKLQLSAPTFHNLFENWSISIPLGVTEVSVGLTDCRLLFKMSYIFPTLRKLEISAKTFMEQKYLDIIFTRLDTLQELVLESIFPSLADSQLTGFSNSNEIRKELTQWKLRNRLSLAKTKPSMAEIMDKFIKDTGRPDTPSLRNMKSKPFHT